MLGATATLVVASPLSPRGVVSFSDNSFRIRARSADAPMPTTPWIVSVKLNFRKPNHRKATNANSTVSAMSMAASPFVPTKSFVV